MQKDALSMPSALTGSGAAVPSCWSFRMACSSIISSNLEMTSSGDIALNRRVDVGSDCMFKTI